MGMEIKNRERNLMQARKSTHRKNSKKSLIVFSPLLFILLVSPIVLGLTYNDEIIKTDLTSFEWCFNPDLQKDFYKDNFEVYVDNIGNSCDITNTKLYAVIPLEYTQTDYWNETTCLLKDDKTQPKDLNGSYQQIEECETILKSKSYSIKEESWVDTSLTDVFMTKDMKFCYVGTRNAKTGFQSCDMNFKVDLDNDGILEYDVADDGKAWWNSTFGSKFLLDIQTTENEYNIRPIPILLNSTDHPNIFSSCANDGSDVRITNIDENITLPINITYFNSTDALIYVNETLNFTGYLYCNNAIATSISETAFGFSELDTQLNSYYKFDDLSGDVSDWFGLHNLIETGSVSSQTGLIEKSRGPYPSGNAFSVADTRQGTDSQLSVETWIYYDGGVLPAFSVVYGWNASASQNTLQLFYVSGTNTWTCGMSGADATYVGPITTGWYQVICNWYGTDDIVEIYVNGVTGSNGTASVPTRTGEAWRFGSDGAGNNPSTEFYFDELAIYTKVLNKTKVLASYNDGVGKTVQFHEDVTSLTVGSEETLIISTDIDFGLFDEDLNNISLFVNEGEEFHIWANYTYSENNTHVDNSFCNFTAYEIVEEHYDRTIGLNTSLCLSGCDYINRTSEFTGLDIDGSFIEDIYKFQICQNSATKPNFNVASSCGYSQEFSGSVVPLCSVGYLELEIIDYNCSGISDINLSIWSDATNLAKSLTLVDDFVGIDREHNHTGNLTYNATLDVFITQEYEYYEHGNKIFDGGCYSPQGGILNQTGQMNITVANIPPTIFIDEIWWWLLPEPIVFNNDTVARYPLESTINITGLCVDDDLYSVGINLSYGNGTLIDEFITLYNGSIFDGIITYTRSDFSNETSYLSGANDYYVVGWCNDTSNNLTSQRKDFTAQNNEPIINFDDSSPVLISSIPYNISWVCTDFESETLNNYIYVNGILNTTTTNQYYLFNYPEGDYNVTVFCGDSFYNSSDELIINYFSSCITNINGLTSWDRYRDTTKEISINCSNNVNLSSCSYEINRFAIESFNCLGANLTLELGKNDILFTIVDENGFTQESELTVYAKKKDSSLADYFLFGVIILALIFVVWFAQSKFNTIASHFLVIIVMIIASLYAFSFSFWIGIIGLIIVTLYGFWFAFS